MPTYPRQLKTSRILTLALLVTFTIGLKPASALGQSTPPGLTSETTYQSPQFGLSLTWQAPWAYKEGSITSSTGSNDQITLTDGTASANVIVTAATGDVSTIFDPLLAGLQVGGGQFDEISRQTGDGYLAATVDTTVNTDAGPVRVRKYIEAGDEHFAGSAAIRVIAVFTAPADDLLAEWTSFTTNVHRDAGQPVFHGSPDITPGSDAAATETNGDIPAGVITYTITDRGHDNDYRAWPQVPPAGGIHNNVWQKCQFYDAPIDPGKGVHALEHGAVWITFDPNLPADEIAQIKLIANGQEFVLASPYVGLPAPIVVTSWNHQLYLQTVDDKAIAQFIKVFKNSPTYTPEYGASCATGSTDTVP
jgi:hypothetical protein